MLAHNAAASYSMNANFPPAGPLAGPRPNKRAAGGKAPPTAWSQLQRGAAGGVPLATVVFFNNLNVTPGATVLPQGGLHGPARQRPATCLRFEKPESGRWPLPQRPAGQATARWCTAHRGRPRSVHMGRAAATACGEEKFNQHICRNAAGRKLVKNREGRTLEGGAVHASHYGYIRHCLCRACTAHPIRPAAPAAAPRHTALSKSPAFPALHIAFRLASSAHPAACGTEPTGTPICSSAAFTAMGLTSAKALLSMANN